MRKVFALLACAAAALSLSTCAFEDTRDPEVEWERVQAQAQDKTAQAIILAAQSYESGDQAALAAFLEAEDTSGEMAALFDEQLKTAAVAPKAELLPWVLGPPTAEDFQDGDVLLFTSSGDTATALLMSMILINPTFGHAGIVDGNKVENVEGDFVLSATVELDSDNLVNGLCYQRLQDLIDHSVAIARLRYVGVDISAVGAAIGIFEETILPLPNRYAFVDFLLQPIKRDDLSNWYCSKVPWYIYDMAGSDIEDSNYYELDNLVDGKWMEQRGSILYKVYMQFIRLITPNWLQRWLYRQNPNWLQDAADRHLRYVLDELITPDELSTYDNINPYAVGIWVREGVPLP